MELHTLHPFPDGAAEMFLRQSSEDATSDDGNTDTDPASRFWTRPLPQHPRPSDVTFGFAVWLAARQPVFAHPGLSLSAWEARVDRGSGMLVRPPSRLFGEAGLATDIARSMPIRIESGDAMMGGAFVPARLVDRYLERLDTNLERSVRRLVEAERDPLPVMSLMYEAARYAAGNGLGLFEAIDVLDPADPSSWPPGARVVAGSHDRALLERIQLAARPQKEPGLIARLFSRRR